MPDAILILDVIKSGNLSSLIVPVVMFAALDKLVAVVAVPVRFAVMVPALKLPEPSLNTIVDSVLAEVAPVLTVNVAAPELLYVVEPLIPLPEVLSVSVLSSVPVTIPATIPEPVIVVAEPTVNEVVMATTLGRPIVSVFPAPTVSISFVVPAIVKVSLSRSIAPVPVSPAKSKLILPIVVLIPATSLSM